jgi:transposase
MARTIRRVSEQERREICALYRNGTASNQISKLLGRSRQTVVRVLRKEGILLSKVEGKLRRIPTEIRDQAVALYQAGKTADEVAALGLHSKLTRSVIFNELRRRGIPTRRAGNRGFFWGREEDQKRVCEYYQLGMSGSALADIYKCSRDAINKVLRAANIQVRSFDETTGLKWIDASGRIFFMRSLWEVKTAKWLDDAGRKWDYEKCRYDVGDGHTYTPDFWVYENGELIQLIDVKGWLRPASAEAISAFRVKYPQFPFVVWDEPQLREQGILDIKIEGEDVSPGPSYPVCVTQVADEEKDKIAELYLSGLTIRAAAKAVGRSHTIAEQVVKERGIVRSKAESKRRRVPQEERDRAATLYLAGDSITTVAKKTGLSRDVVYGEVKRRGINRKRRGDDRERS